MYIDFARPELLLLLTLLPLWAIAVRQLWGTGVMYSGGDPSGLHQHATAGGRFFLLLPNVISGATMVLLIVALAGPQSIEIVPRTAPRGAGIALAVDLSTSMLAEDMEGRSRLDVARDAASLFAEMRADDELALVAFAGHALTRIPSTYDERLVLAGIESLDPDMIRNGTNIAGGILTSLEQLLASEGEPRVIVLLTDGAHNGGGSPLAAARAAAAVGVRIHSISLLSSTEEISTERETMLAQVSELSGGRYFRARSAEQLNAIYLQIDRMEVAAERIIEESVPRPQRWPLISALVLMALGAVLRGDALGDGALSFSYPVFVPIGGVLALIVVLGIWAHARRRRLLAQFLGGYQAAGRLSGSRLHRLQIDRMLLLGSAAFAAALAAAGPYQPVFDETEEAPVRGTVVVAIDVSASMQANDVLPSRLSQGIQIARELVAAPANANVGVLLFAGRGYPLAHPTDDLSAVDFLMQGVGPSVSSPQDPGSMLSSAILEAAMLLEEGTPGGGERSIILISDGESGEAEAEVLAAVREAASQGIRVHSVGVGTLTGGQIPAARASGELAGFVLEPNGAPAVSRLQAPLLQSIADEGGGAYAHFEETGDLERLRRMLQSAGPSSATATLASRDLTLLLTAMSLVLVVLDSLLELLDRRRTPRPRIPEFRMRFR